jgi:isoleucyl-tRNA synthetase
MADEFHKNFVSWDFHKAGRSLEDFVVNDLSNWYVRRSRRRLWEESDSNDKRACQHTLHEVLLIVCRLMAPISPFMPDAIHRGLTGTSVHLTDWPIGSDLVDRALPTRDFGIEQEMSLVRSLAEAGRRIRVESSRRQRLPCQTGWIVGGPDISRFNDILAEELNVEVLTTEADLDAFQKIALEPNRKVLGAKCRSDLPSVLAQLDMADPEELLLEIEAGIAALGGYEITMDDIEIRRVEKEGFAAQKISFDEGDVSIVLDMHIDSALLSKGMARDITRRIQAKRKEMNLQVESSISLSVWVKGLALENSDWEHVIIETRAGEHSLNEGKPSSNADIFEVDGTTVSFQIQ